MTLTLITWRCRFCGHVERQPSTAREVLHACPARRRREFASLERK